MKNLRILLFTITVLSISLNASYSTPNIGITDNRYFLVNISPGLGVTYDGFNPTDMQIFPNFYLVESVRISTILKINTKITQNDTMETHFIEVGVGMSRDAKNLSEYGNINKIIVFSGLHANKIVSFGLEINYKDYVGFAELFYFKFNIPLFTFSRYRSELFIMPQIGIGQGERSPQLGEIHAGLNFKVI